MDGRMILDFGVPRGNPRHLEGEDAHKLIGCVIMFCHRNIRQDCVLTDILLCIECNGVVLNAGT